MLIASFGSAGDDADRELAAVLADVERELASPSRTVELVVHDARLTVADLFLPSQPPRQRTAAPVTWCFHVGAVASLMSSPPRRSALFERMRLIAASNVKQAAFVRDGVTRAGRAFADAAREIDVEVRAPDASHGIMLLEVTRPRETLCALAGCPHDLVKQPDAGRTAPDAPVITYRSPRLKQLVLGSPNAVPMDPVARELMSRPEPVFLMRDPASPSVEMRNMGGEAALPVYPDVTTLQWAVADLQKSKCVPGAVEFRTLLRMAASQRCGIAVCVYRDRKSPVHVVMRAAQVSALTR